MRDLSDFLSIAARRIVATMFLARASVTLAAGAGAALGLVLATKSIPSFEVAWMWVGPMLALAALVAAGMWTYRARPTPARVALTIDERLDLRERLTTALYCLKRDDAFAQAAVEDAVVLIRNPKTAEALKRRVRVAPPSHWYAAPLLALAAAGASALPAFSFFGAGEAAQVEQAAQEARDQKDAVLAEVERQLEESAALREELAATMGDLTKEGQDPRALQTPEQIKRDAIKRMTELNQRLEELLDGEKAKTADALKDAMSQLKPPEDGPAKELAEAMAKGDFAGAQQALQELQKKLEEGKLNDEQKKQLQQQMQNLADQLDKLAQQQKALEDALKQAGLDPQLAGNPQALEQAMQNNPNLNQQQKQQIQQMADAQKQACQMCQGMGAACQNMAQQMAQGGQGMKDGQAAQQLSKMLSDAEMMEEMLKQASACQGACQKGCNGMGQGLALQQQLQQQNQMGNGMGNRGIGRGGNAPIAPTPTGAKAQKENTKFQENAEIIAKQFIQGEPIIGEAKTKLEKVSAQVDETYEEGLSEDAVNPRYREAHRRYFSEVKSRLDKAKNQAGSKPQDAAKPAEKPASESGS
jgi:hypothetical protein